MTKKALTNQRFIQPYRYASPNIPRAAIKRFALKIAERFQPERIVLFGSYAYGNPHEESDVDLLVIMPARNGIDKSVQISLAFEREFALDLIVRTPFHVKQGLRDGDWFLCEVIQKGIVLYEAPNNAVGSQSRR
jgi:predicted nucleotidyltransferase